MEPFICQSGEAGALPAGWTTDPIGAWHGVESEVAFHPGRHDIVMVRGEGDCADRGLSEGGFVACTSAPEGAMWIRDRSALVRAALDRLRMPDERERATLERTVW